MWRTRLFIQNFVHLESSIFVGQNVFLDVVWLYMFTVEIAQNAHKRLLRTPHCFINKVIGQPQPAGIRRSLYIQTLQFF